jgi:oligoribonuclease (3'-5' exoribonuclease)
MSSKHEIAYLSFDIETDGPSPLVNSLLSIGICLIDENENIIDQLEINIMERENSTQDPKTMEWWHTQQVAWNICHQNQLSCHEAMNKISEFYKKWSQHYKLIWIGMPVCFDWMFLKSYYCAFAPQDAPDIGFKATCISTIRDYSIKNKVITNKEYDDIVSSIPKGVEHRALDDAKMQGFIFIRMNKYIKKKQTKTN